MEKPVFACCSSALARRLATRQVELLHLALIEVEHITLIDDEGTFWLWPIVSNEKASNSPCQ